MCRYAMGASRNCCLDRHAFIDESVTRLTTRILGRGLTELAWDSPNPFPVQGLGVIDFVGVAGQ